MAAPVIPGADRQFIADPGNASGATQMGDLAAINLQMLHLLNTVLPDGPNKAMVVQATARTNQILEASKISQARESATRELRPLTRLPDAPWGVTRNIAHIRMHSVPTFTGTSSDTLDVVRWISRITNLAEANTLSFASAINLMIQGSSGDAADYIEQLKDEGKNLPQIVQLLEMRFGDLCTPEEARVKTNNMARLQDESLSKFIARLRAMANMACRMEDTDATRREAVELLIEGNIRRVLPTSVRNALGERVITRSSMGLPAFTAREIEKECLDLERRRDERKTQITGPVATKQHRAQINRLAIVQATDSSDDSNSSADEVDCDDGATYQFVNIIKQVQHKFAQKGKFAEPQKVYRKALLKFNGKYPARNQGNQPYGARQVGQGGNAAGYPPLYQQGPPNNLEGQPRKTVLDLLALANIQKGSCIQCGVQGHYMKNDQCALRDKVLVDRACVKCGKGLHQADDCPIVFQKQYVATPQAVNVLSQSQETLNED